MNRRSWFRPSGSLVSTLLLASCGFALSGAAAKAQAPTTAVGATSATQTAIVTITTNGTHMLQNIAVVTQGAANQDYQVVTPNTATPPPLPCTVGTNYEFGDTCTVQYTFSPKHPWSRYGGISLSDKNGVLLGNVFLTGKGTGPQISFPPSATTVPTTLFGGSGTPAGVALDGNGNLYFVDYNGNALKEIPATNGVIPTNPAPAATTVATAFSFPSAVAVDGSGNIFVIDASNNGALKEIVAVGGVIPAGATPVTVASNLGGLSSLAVDGNGNVYVATATAVLKYTAVNGVIPAGATGTSVNGSAEVSAAGIAVDAAGDLYYIPDAGDPANPASVFEFVATAGVIPPNPTPVTLATVNGRNSVNAIAIDGGGNLYLPAPTQKSIYEIEAVNGSFTGVTTPVVATLSSTLSGPFGLVIDGSGNIFIAENTGTAGAVDMLNVQAAATVKFTSTEPGTPSSDSPMPLAVGNNGTDPLVFSATTGSDVNPSPTAGFTIDPSSTCPQVTSATGALSLAPGAPCTYAIDFDPGAAGLGPVSGTLTLTDNSLNVTTPPQSVPLTGGVASPTITVKSFSAPVDTTNNTLTATIAYNGVQPNVTNTVTFTVNGGSTIPATCTGTASPLTCTATYDDSSLAAASGGYPIVANFAGDTSNNPESGTGTLTVIPGTPGLQLVTSGSPATVDTPLTFTATVTPNTGTIVPTGTVSFTSTLGAGSPTPIANCTGLTPASGVVQCTPTGASTLAAGSYTITAILAGDTNFTGQTATVSQTVTKATPVVGVTTTHTSVPVNGSVTFTATVTPNTGITPSMVSFTSTLGAGLPTAISPSCTNVSLTAGSATCTTSALNAGSYTITATVPGDSNFISASGGVAQNVTTVVPTVSLTTTDNAPTVNGPVTLTATVTPNAGIVPNGTVTFTSTLGVTTTTLCSSVTLVPGAGPSLTASCPTTTLQAGTNSIAASLAADPADTNFSAATATPITENVSKATPALTTTSSVPGTSPLNGSVTFTATVTPNSGTIPTGKVTFTTSLDGGTTVVPLPGCTNPVSLNTGTPLTATCTTTLLNAGANSVVASIASDSNFKTATAAPITETVAQGTATVTLDLGPAPVATNGTSTLTATITPNTGVAPTGTVNFTNLFNGTTASILNCGAVPLVAGTSPTTLTATCITNTLLAGTDTITAILGHDNNYPDTSSASRQDFIHTADTTLAVTSTPVPSATDQQVTFTATLSSTSPFTPTLPKGSVTFNNTTAGEPIVGCNPVTLDPASHTATCTTSGLSAGSNIILVNFAPSDPNFNASIAPNYTQTVIKGATSTALVSSLPAAVVNQLVTFTATVTPNFASANGVPMGGSVAFTKGGVSVCSAGVISPNANGTGTASCSVAFTTAFASTGIVATYSGDTNFTTSNSSVNQTVGAASTTTTVASQQNPSTVNTPVTLTATVTFPNATGAIFPATATAPSGTVTFSDSLDVANPISCTPAPATITNGAPSTVSCTHTFATQGNHIITATFTPSGTETNYAGSTSSSITEQVNASGAISITVGTTTPTVTVNQTATFTAAFTPPLDPAATQPAGTVTYFDSLLVTPSNTTGAIPNCGTLAVTSAKPATIPNCNETMFAAGTHIITAKFTPSDGNFQAMTSQNFSEIVGPTATTVALTSLPPTSVVDQAVTFTATVTPATAGTTNPTGTVSFTYVLNGTTTPICSPATVSTTGGVTSATCTGPLTAFGKYNVTATYSPDLNTSNVSNFQTSTSASYQQNVVLANTSVTFSSSTPPSPAVNQPVTYTVHISPVAPASDTAAGSAVPTGTVSFSYVLNGVTTQLCTPVPAVSTTGAVSSASCTAAIPATGTYTITATYSGDTNFATSPTTFQQTIGLSATTTSITGVTPTNAPAVNAPVSLNATVTPTNGGSTIPSGTVTFTDSNPPNADGTCVSTLAADGSVPPCPYSFTTSGTHMLTAKYSGDTKGFSTSTSAPFSVTVGTASGLNPVVSSKTPSITVDQKATFSASFNLPSNVTQPTGKVSYSDGTNVICANLTITAGNIPDCDEIMLTAGTHNITVNYQGDSNFVPVQSQPFPQTVAQNTTTVSLTSPTAPSVTDQVVTFTATVTPATLTPSGPGTTTPTGTVAFTYGASATAICSGTVSATTGVATCSVPLTAAGSYALTATYSGDTNFKTSSVTPPSPQKVNMATTNIGLGGASSITPTSPAVNQSAPYTVQISVPAPASGPGTGSTVPTGVVVFTDASNSAVTCTVAAVQPNGLASCSLTEPTAGAHTINVTYSGDSNFSGAGPTSFPVTVGLSNTTMSQLTVAPPGNPTVNQGVTLSATLNFSASGTATPSGTVTFTDTLAGNVVGTCPSLLASGIAPPCQYTFTVAGNHTLTASYPGDSNFGPSSTSIPVTVGGVGSTSIVVGTPTVVINQSAVLTAAFTPKITGTTQPQGSVSYFDSALVNAGNPTGKIAGCSALVVIDNTPPTQPTIPSCTETMLVSSATTPHNITVAFASSNSNFASFTSPQFPEIVTPNTTTVTISSPTASSIPVDTPETFSATITPTPLTPPVTGTTSPTGIVTFTYSLVPAGGGTATSGPICTATLATSSNATTAVCTPQIPLTQTGTYTIIATYTPDPTAPNFTAPGSPTTFSQTVSAPATTLTIGAPASPQINVPVTFKPKLSTSVNTTGLATPTGLVTLTDGPGGPVICSAQPAPDGTVTCVPYIFPTAGPHNIIASYAGDANFAPVPSFSTQISVSKGTPNISVTSSSTTSIASQAVTFIATVTPNPSAPGVTPTGAIAITITGGNLTAPIVCPATPVPSATSDEYSCTYTFDSTVAGALTVTATYPVGDTNYNAITGVTGTNTLTQTVLNFFPTVSQTAITLAEGSSVANTTNENDAFHPGQQIVYTENPTAGFPVNTTAITSCYFVNSSLIQLNPQPTGLSCATVTQPPPSGSPTNYPKGSVLITATPAAAIGSYTVQLLATDLSAAAHGLFHLINIPVTVIAQPKPVFVGAVGTVKATFTLANPATLTTSLACNSAQIATSNPDGTYTLTGKSFADIGIQCTVDPTTHALFNQNTDGSYYFTITAGQPTATAKLETRNSVVIAATLGAPFLLLFGLLPAFRKQRKLLLRSLGMLLMGLAILQTTGCGGGGFTASNPPQAVIGSYLIAITNTTTNTTVAEVPLIIGNN